MDALIARKHVMPGFILTINPELAAQIGLNEAIILEQVHYWTRGFWERDEAEAHYRDGHWWVWNSMRDWQLNFPFWSKDTIARAIRRLRNGPDPLLIVGQYNKRRYDRTFWYRVDYEAVDRLGIALSEVADLRVGVTA